MIKLTLISFVTSVPHFDTSTMYQDGFRPLTATFACVCVCVFDQRHNKDLLFPACLSHVPLHRLPSALQHTLLFPSQQGHYSLFTVSGSLSDTANAHSSATKMSAAAYLHTRHINPTQTVSHFQYFTHQLHMTLLHLVTSSGEGRTQILYVGKSANTTRAKVKTFLFSLNQMFLKPEVLLSLYYYYSFKCLGSFFYCLYLFFILILLS